MANQAAALRIRKYCGLTDSRTPPEFIREFVNSTRYTRNDFSDIRHFLACLDSQFDVYIAAFYNYGSFEGVKSYFLKLTWTDADKQEELEAVKAEKWDAEGEESWEKYLIRSYIRLQDCEANDEEFQKIMISKLFQVGKSDLPVNNFNLVRKESSGYSQTREVQRIASNDLPWFAEIVYAESSRELKNQLKLDRNAEAAAEGDRQSDAKCGVDPKKSEIFNVS